MNRREIIAGLGSAAAWPVVARAQQPPVIGFVHVGSANDQAVYAPAFRKGLGESGYVEGQNVAVEYRYAENQADRLPALAADLVRRRVAVIVARSGPAALAAKAATSPWCSNESSFGVHGRVSCSQNYSDHLMLFLSDCAQE